MEMDRDMKILDNSGEREIQARALLAVLLMLGAFTALSWRLINIQLVGHERYAKLVDSYHGREIVLPARRGAIKDRHGELLACDQPMRELFADKQHLFDEGVMRAAVAVAEGSSVREVKASYGEGELKLRFLGIISEVLARPLARPADEIYHELASERPKEQVLAKNVGELESRGLEKFIREMGVIRGLYLRPVESRFYNHVDRMTQVVGMVDFRHRGVSGVEASMEQWLIGEPGSRWIEVDAKRREVVNLRGKEVPPRDGHDVHLACDMGLQEILEGWLDRAMDEYRPEKALAVVVRPATGEILAMASRPNFERGKGESAERNHTIADRFEPGSIFKTVVYAGAFDRKLVGNNTMVHCEYGRYDDPGVSRPIFDHHPYGELTVSQAFAKSSNIGSYKLARQLGRPHFSETMRAFGFGARTGIQLPGEVAGTLRPVERWTDLSVQALSKGYEIDVTALQMVMAGAAIANGGVLMKPQIIREIRDPEGGVVRRFPPVAVRRVMSPEAARMVTTAMVETVAEGGTGTKAAIPGYLVAGKTGTAWKNIPGRGYDPRRYVASFLGFAPADQPELCCLVVLDDAKIDEAGAYGGAASAPVWAGIIKESLEYLEVAPGLPVAGLGDDL